MSHVILVVDDEEDLIATLEYNLHSEGYLTRCAGTGMMALQLAEKDPLPSAILLDLMLPDISGVEVCRRLRANPKTARVPVIMVSARGEEFDRVVGFEVGADDYVVKPFSTRELMLRLRGHLKVEAAPPRCDSRLEFGQLKVDTAAHRTWVNQKPVVLTALEFRLLVTLLTRRGRVQTRDSLLQDVWGVLANVTTRTVDTHVKRLRSKLGAAGEYIETLRGVGYRFCGATPPNRPAESSAPRPIGLHSELRAAR